ncbi:hypothetical protein [Bartonella harrusi]
MKIYTLDDVVELVDKYNDIINFRTEENVADDLLIEPVLKTL